MTTRWEDIREALQVVYGVDMVKETTPETGMVSYKGVPLAVVYMAPDFVHLSLRSSILPNDAGLIVGAIAKKHQVMLGGNFEIKNGSVVVDTSSVSIMGKSLEVDSPEYEESLEKQKLSPN